MRTVKNHIPLLLISLSVMLAVLALYVYMNYAVRQSSLRAAGAYKAVKEEEINKSQEEEIVELFHTTAEKRSRLSEFFVPANDAVSFIEYLETLGQRTGTEMDLSSIEADDLSKAAPGTLGTIRVHVSASGTWSSVMRLLMIAENLPYASSVNGVHLESASPNPEKSGKQWNLQFSLNTSIISN